MGSNNAYMPCSNLKMPNYDMKVVFHGSNNIEQLQAWIAAARTYAKWYEANMTEPQRVALLLSTLKDGAQVWASLLLTAEPGAFRTVEELITKLLGLCIWPDSWVDLLWVLDSPTRLFPMSPQD